MQAEKIAVDPRVADNSFEAKVSAVYNNTSQEIYKPSNCYFLFILLTVLVSLYFVNEAECLVNFCRGELQVPGGREPTVTSSIHRANHSGMKRPRKRGEVTQEEPSIPMCIPSDSTASR